VVLISRRPGVEAPRRPVQEGILPTVDKVGSPLRRRRPRDELFGIRSKPAPPLRLDLATAFFAFLQPAMTNSRSAAGQPEGILSPCVDEPCRAGGRDVRRWRVKTSPLGTA
jgi:hypothetical protein